WVGNHSWDIDGDPLVCGMKQNAICFQGNCSYFDNYNSQCVQLGCCNDTPDVPEGIAFGNDNFAGVWGHGGLQGAIRSSTNGVDWLTRAPRDSFSTAFGNGRFVAAGNPTTAWSTDGVTWTSGGMANFSTMGSPVRAMGYGPYANEGRFVAISTGNGHDVLVSSDGGATWWRPSV